MPKNNSGSIEREIRIAASPETVFEFLTDPSKMLKWIGVEVDLDPRPGGIFKINANGIDIIRGKFVEVIPSRKVVFTWGWEGGGGRVAPGSTKVEITLVPDGDGTILRLKHTGLTDEDFKKHDYGWGHYIERIKTLAEGGDPGPDPLRTPEIRHG